MEIQRYIEEIKSRITIVDYIGKFVSLKKAGRNFTGLCPFHIEKTPSFSVSPEKGIFFCFGCRTGGDVVAFAMKFEGLTFKEAVEHLGNIAGIEPPTWKEGGSKSDNSEFYELMQFVSNFFHENLLKNETALGYLKNRGISLPTIEKFSIGYAPPNSELLLNQLKERKIDLSRASYLGIVTKDSDGRYYSYFRDRIIFPIQNSRGSNIGFGGRTINDQQMPKYLNSPDNAIFHKGMNLFAMNQAKQSMAKENAVILVEGYMDVISLHQHGIENVVASLGTAFTMDQAGLLHKHVPMIYFCYDNDVAGKKATLRALELLMPTEIPCKIIEIPEPCKDPDEYILMKGKEAFYYLVEKAKSTLDYIWDTLKKNIKPDDSLSLNESMDKMMHYLLYLNQTKNTVLIERMIKKMALDYNLLPMSLQERMKLLESSEKMYSSRNRTKKTEYKGLIPDRNGERILLKACIELSEHYLEKIMQEIVVEDFSDSLHRLLFQKIRENYQNLGYIQLNELYDRLEDKEIYALISELLIMDSCIINDTSIRQVLEKTKDAKKMAYRLLLLSRINKATKEGDIETHRILREEFKRIVG